MDFPFVRFGRCRTRYSKADAGLQGSTGSFPHRTAHIDMSNPFLERVQQGPIIADGAMGTMLYSSGVPLDSSFDVLNLSNPELVASIHRAYIAAGAEIIETNSYGANRFKLEQLGLGNKVRQLNRV